MKNLFLKQNADGSKYKDAVFAASAMAKLDKQAINSTVGSLYDENGTIAAYDSVYKCMNSLPNQQKAAYCSSIGGDELFNQLAYDWLNRENYLNIDHRQVATIGGSGAIYLTFKALQDAGKSILLPDIAWGAYKMIVKNLNLEIANYRIVDDNNQMYLDDLFIQSEKMMDEEGRVVVLINDPAQNPTGISYGKENWQKIISFFNDLSKKGPVIIVNDVAYIDYCGDSREYLSCFNDINENVFVAITMSFSKTLTAYGSRLGCAVLLAKDQDSLEEVYNYCIKLCRSTWGSSNNVLMKTFISLMQQEKENFLSELNQHVDLIKQRADIFLNEAKKYHLNVLPYTEGFFCFIKCDDPVKVFNKLVEKHVYVVQLAKGIRISMCSLSKENCQKLPAILDEVINHE